MNSSVTCTQQSNYAKNSDIPGIITIQANIGLTYNKIYLYYDR